MKRNWKARSPDDVIQEFIEVFWKYNAGSDVVSVGISMDGSYTVAGTEYEKNVYLIDNNGSLLWKKSMDDWIECVSISGNGDYIVAGVRQCAAGEPDIFLFNKDREDIWGKRPYSRHTLVCIHLVRLGADVSSVSVSSGGEI